MSTTPTDQTQGATAGAPENETAAQPVSTSEGTLANVPDTETEPGWVTRHTSTLIALMVAVVVAALAIAGVALYRHDQDEQNADTEAAFSAYIADQGAAVETVECHGDTCAAVIGTNAYTVLVQEDAKGEQHFGVSAYVGD